MKSVKKWRSYLGMVSLLQDIILGHISTRICVVEEFDAFLRDLQGIKRKLVVCKTRKIMSHINITEFYYDLDLLLLFLNLRNRST